MSASPSAQPSEYIIRKIDHLGARELFRYNGTLVSHDESAIVLQAAWSRAALDLGYLSLRPGDPFLEIFYLDRWHNVFEIRGADGALKGWYANITRPTRVHENFVDWDDLKLDVWMSPNGDWFVMDEDEFDEIAHELPAHEAATARGAVQNAIDDLRQRWRAHANEHIAQKLAVRGWTLGTAESCTGGLIGDVITNRSGCSSYFMGGIISYDNRIKRDVLGVSEAILQGDGAVSEPCARAMARGARRALGVDVAVSATGIAGPLGGSEDKPVGLVYVGISTPEAERAERFVWPHDRMGNKRATADAALKLLMNTL